VSFLLILIGTLFGFMVGGLFVGHIIFMCWFRKTTNESLKRSEKYGYKFV